MVSEGFRVVTYGADLVRADLRYSSSSAAFRVVLGRIAAATFPTSGR